MPVPKPQTGTTLPPKVLTELAIGTDWVSTWWPPAVLLVLAGALAVVAARRRRPGRDGRPAAHDRRWPAVVGAVLALALAAGSAVNSFVGYVPSVAAGWLLVSGNHPPDASEAGQITAWTIPAPAQTRMPASTTWVYTPPGYQPGGAVRYPVLYLVHGTPGESADWFSGGDIAHVLDVLIANRLIRPMIVVAPDVNGRGQDDTECLNSTRGGSQVETYLDAVVVPWVDGHYSTRADWSHRSIGGMSAGGFCALDQGLRHPELYGSVLAIEPYDNPGSGGRAMLSTQAQFDAHSPGRYLPTMTFAHPLPTFLDVGARARGGDPSVAATLAGTLRARGQTVLLREEPGQGHTWTMARTGVPYGLIFASAAMPP